MTKLRIVGGNKLSGEIKISGAKNAALKILPAAILADTPGTISNVPDIADIGCLLEILTSIGARIQRDSTTVVVDPSQINSTCPDPHLVKKLRGSIVLIGPLLAKFGEAAFSQPGGCLIGARPIDDHLDVFKQMGVEVAQVGDTYHLKGKPKACEITLNTMSVTATENAIMAAVLSPGTTTIHVAAAEPEIADLAKFLNKMGAKVTGAGTHDIIIEGVERLAGVEYSVMPDRIEAGTYIIAAAATNSELTIGPIIPEHLSLVLKKLRSMGANFEIMARNDEKYIKTKHHDHLNSVNMDTRTYPGFPTDLQSPFAVLLTQATGQGRIFETIFDGRFLYLNELQKMGANSEVLSPHIIQIYGPTPLRGKTIISQDIRGGAALVIAALAAKGETTIEQAELIDRGYERIDQKLQAVGANIERIG